VIKERHRPRRQGFTIFNLPARVKAPGDFPAGGNFLGSVAVHFSRETKTVGYSGKH
jgi:hypothetical protein